MDFETFLQSLISLMKNSDNLYYVLYATATCLLTQVFKKLFVNKVKVDVLHKFDFAVILPFIFGAIFGTVDLIFVRHISFSFAFVYKVVISAATIGALATVIFKFISSLSGQSLKSLLKDDTFGVFFNQLLYFGTIRERLINKEISLKDFIAEVKLLSANAVKIYATDETEEVKKDKLFRLMEGVVDADSITDCVDVLNKALLAVSTQKTGSD